MFVDLVSFAQSDHPEGMFELCVTFITNLCQRVRSLNLMHNSRVHRHLLQLMKFITDNVSNDLIEVTFREFDLKSRRKVKIILRYVEMVVCTALNKDPELIKFFVEEISRTSSSNSRPSI